MRGGSGGSWLRQPQSSAGGAQERVRQAQINGIAAFGDGRPCVAELHQPLGRAPREGGEGAQLQALRPIGARNVERVQQPSLVAPDYGISVTDVYQVTKDKGIVATPNAGGLSVRTPTALGERTLEAAYARGWYRNISADTCGGKVSVPAAEPGQNLAETGVTAGLLPPSRHIC